MGEAVEDRQSHAAAKGLLTSTGLGLATVVALSLATVPPAVAGPPADGSCGGAGMWVVCEADNDTAAPESGASPAGSSSGSSGGNPVCTVERMNPQPPPGSMFWGRTEDDPDGVVYMRTCRNGEGGTPVYSYFAAADGADVPAIDPVVLAQQAVSKMKLSGPAIASPRVTGRYVVGMPMWLWVDQSPTTYGPQTTSATAGGVTVSATAKVTSISWDMGDGSGTVVCDGPGMKYEPSMGKARSPDCGHVYVKASGSRDGGRFTVTATATWTVDWAVDGGGETGQFTEFRQSEAQVAIGELQVVR